MSGNVEDRIALLEAEVARLKETIKTVAAWLAQTPGVWGTQDYRAVADLIDAPVEPLVGDTE